MIVEELVPNEIILGEMYNFCDPRGTSMILGFGLGLYFYFSSCRNVFIDTEARTPISVCGNLIVIG